MAETWKNYFIISGCTKFVIPGIGEIDASKDNLAIPKLEEAYARKCPYVSLTKQGIEKYEPQKNPIQVKKIETEGDKPKKKYFTKESPD